MPLENLQLYYTEGHAFVVHGGKKCGATNSKPYKNQQACNEGTPTLPNPKILTSTVPAIKVMFNVLFDIQDPCFQISNQVMT
jgi:hypothetical protein